MNDFLKELKVLMEKHDASIGFICSPCGDCYCLNNGGIVVEVGKERKEFGYLWLLPEDIDE